MREKQFKTRSAAGDFLPSFGGDPDLSGKGVKFILNKPIAVSMIYLALLVLGIVALKQIPVSLMPDIAIPKITVQVSEPDMPARELENSIVKPLRQQLMQVAHLEDIKSETQDGLSTISLTFHYGANIDLAFIEVNEKVDRSMNFLPKTLSRPKIIKASAGDIPVFYLNLTLKNSQLEPQAGNLQNSNTKETVNTSSQSEASRSNFAAGKSVDLYPVSTQYVELSNFSNQVIRKRIEQLPEVAMVDISGLVQSELLILIDPEKLRALDLTADALKQIIQSNNIKLGNLSINDGQYRYNIRFDAEIRNSTDLENIYLKVNDRVLQLKDIARVVQHPQKLKGTVLSNGNEAITLAVIKQADAQMNSLKGALHELVVFMQEDYPDIDFEITRDQTRLLEYSIQNLGQTLWIGGLLAFVIMFVFLRGWKSPVLIGITIPVSLVLALLMFHLLGLSINIISLSGLILGVGMMIDNSIIVIDNITQHIQRNLRSQVSNSELTQPEVKSEICNLKPKTSNQQPATSELQLVTSSCASGTSEVFRPMLTSVLTTCAVFIPLIFIEGIAGSLFYDQAMAVTIGLLSSLVVSVTLLPVYYRLFNKKQPSRKRQKKQSKRTYEIFYEKGFNWTMRNQPIAWLLIFLMLLTSVFIYKSLPISQLPEMAETEKMFEIDWNESVSVNENKERANKLVNLIQKNSRNCTALIGEQQFLLDRENAFAPNKLFIYLEAEDESLLFQNIQLIRDLLDSSYTNASYQLHAADNIFNVFFDSDKAPLEVRLRATNDFGPEYLNFLKMAKGKIEEDLHTRFAPIGINDEMVLTVDPYLLVQYDVSHQQVVDILKQQFSSDEIFEITTNDQFLPVVLGSEGATIEEIIQQSFVQSSVGKAIPLRNLIHTTKSTNLKQVVAGNEGEYYALNFENLPNDVGSTKQLVNGVLKADGWFEASYTGQYFINKQLVNQLVIILTIAILLLFFILAAQFESVFLPVIVLLEVPIDIFGVLLFLKLFGAGINLMSLIGIVVMSGIIINDSILKIDTINLLRRNGFGLMKALVEAGHRRLKPIIMTSLTTILALLPFLFMHGLGADLQRPLALAVIGGMFIGTLVSLFFIPLCYYYLVKLKLVR